MTTTSTAPDITPGYPSKGRKLGPAWNDVWAELARSEWSDGRKLAEVIAPRHDLAPATLWAVLQRAARAGLLERKGQDVMSGRGRRVRTFYKVAERTDD